MSWDWAGMTFKNFEYVPTTTIRAGRWIVEWKGSGDASWSALPPVGERILGSTETVLARTRQDDTHANIYLLPQDESAFSAAVSTGPLWNFATMKFDSWQLDPNNKPSKKWIMSWQSHVPGRPTEARDNSNPDFDKLPKAGTTINGIGYVSWSGRDTLTSTKGAVFFSVAPADFVAAIRPDLLRKIATLGPSQSSGFPPGMKKLLEEYAPDISVMMESHNRLTDMINAATETKRKEEEEHKRRRDEWYKKHGYDKCNTGDFFTDFVCSFTQTGSNIIGAPKKLLEDALPWWVIPVGIGVGVLILVPPILGGLRDLRSSGK